MEPIWNNLTWNSQLSLNFPDNIQQFENQNQEVSFTLVKLLRVILIENGERWIGSNVGVKDLLQQVMVLYQKGKFSKEIRTKILILLCDIVLNYRLSSTYGWVLKKMIVKNEYKSSQFFFYFH